MDFQPGEIAEGTAGAIFGKLVRVRAMFRGVGEANVEEVETGRMHRVAIADLDKPREGTTVRQLIEALQRQPQDAVVQIKGQLAPKALNIQYSVQQRIVTIY